MLKYKLNKDKKNNNSKSNTKNEIISKCSIIPLNIYQFWYRPELPLNIKNNIEILKKQNPEFNYVLFNDEMCRIFIKNNFDKNVLYAYDKLKPGKYKSELWRYCILYINGGIYLNINYKLIHNFKLIQLTDNEYYVNNKNYGTLWNGIYNGLIISLPYNYILLNMINIIVDKVINISYNNNYSNNILNALTITGTIAFNNIIISNNYNTNTYLNLSNCNNFILYNNVNILEKYKINSEYLPILNNYINLYNLYDIYNFLYLIPIKKINLTNNIIKIINNNNIPFFTSNPCIILHPTDNTKYIMNFRWINYKLDNSGNSSLIYPKTISLNSYCILDSSFNKLTDDIFLEENENYYNNQIYFGIEDIRLFNYLDNLYYIGSTLNSNNNTIMISANNINLDTSYNLTKKIIKPSFYNYNIIEKNWCYVNYSNKLCIVYKWHPLCICEINNELNTLDIIKFNYKMPNIFKYIKGSSSGVVYNNEIWFVVHTSQKNNYQHLFAIFDNELNLLRYSEPFKLDNSRVEFCSGLIIKENNIILSFSSLDTNIYVAVYDIDYINIIKWYINNI
jgi:mannosyltransferase OCH1-like enzyme